MNPEVTTTTTTPLITDQQQQDAINTRLLLKKCFIGALVTLSLVSLAFWLTGCNPDLHYACPLMRWRVGAFINKEDWQNTACASHCKNVIQEMKAFNCEDMSEDDTRVRGMQFSIEGTKCFEKSPMKIDCNDYQNFYTSFESGALPALYLDWDWKTRRCHFQRKTERYAWASVGVAITVGCCLLFACLWYCIRRSCRNNQSACSTCYLVVCADAESVNINAS